MTKQPSITKKTETKAIAMYHKESWGKRSGLDELTPDDCEIPEIKLLQAASDEVKLHGHKPGTWIVRTTGEDITGCHIVPVVIQPTIVIWPTREHKQSGGGPVWSGTKEAEIPSEYRDDRYYEPAERVHTWLVYLIGSEDTPFLLRCARSAQWGPSKKLASNERNRNRAGKPPGVYALEVEDKTNRNGDRWVVPWFKYVGGPDAAQQRVALAFQDILNTSREKQKSVLNREVVGDEGGCPPFGDRFDCGSSWR